MTIILDAGPVLNFLAVSQENVVIQAAAARGAELCVPATVNDEIDFQAKKARFEGTGVEGTWPKLTESRVRVLNDDITLLEANEADEYRTLFVEAVARISGMEASKRFQNSSSLGEIALIAHASAYAQQGGNVIVLMDDGGGLKQLENEVLRLRRLGAPGQVRLWRTAGLLIHGAEQGWLKGNVTWEAVYTKMRPFDDGLIPLPKLKTQLAAAAERRKNAAG